MWKRGLLLALAGSLAVASAALALAPPARTDAGKSATPVTRVYYFHGNHRCHTCRTIEAYAHEAVTSAFGEDLQSHALDWQVVNVDEAAHKHFVTDFQLYTRSLVLVDARDPRRFKVLEKVWELVSDKPAFRKYVEQEIRAFSRS